MNAIEIIPPREKDLGGFKVRRLIPYTKCRMIGPWIFFDHMGPAEFVAGSGIDVRPHPHINLATVTYLFEGEILHRDSLGNYQTITPGAINLMVAGKGIVHSERETVETRNKAHTLHGLQLWHALPVDVEETEPEFHHYSADKMPPFTVGSCQLRVLMGEAYGISSPVKTFAPTLYLEATLPQGEELKLPHADQLAVYVVSGEVKLEDVQVPQYHLAVNPTEKLGTITAQQPSRIAIIGGRKFSERHIEWNFVSSRKERIEQAKSDWREGNFPKVPGEEESEFIPLP